MAVVENYIKNGFAFDQAFQGIDTNFDTWKPDDEKAFRKKTKNLCTSVKNMVDTCLEGGYGAPSRPATPRQGRQAHTGEHADDGRKRRAAERIFLWYKESGATYTLFPGIEQKVTQNVGLFDSEELVDYKDKLIDDESLARELATTKKEGQK